MEPTITNTTNTYEIKHDPFNSVIGGITIVTTTSNLLNSPMFHFFAYDNCGDKAYFSLTMSQLHRLITDLNNLEQAYHKIDK